MKNDTMRFIDSCVGNIARKIEDEFNENDHPRDKGGKFTSAGKESRKASGMYGGEKVKKEDPKKGDALNEHAVKLEKAGADPKEVHRLNREGDLEGMKKLLEETEAEKSAKEELSEHERKLEAIKKDDEEFNKMSNELLDIASDLDTANDALRALGWDDDYDDLEQAHEALKEAIRRDPETAKELLENTPGRDEEDEEESPAELIQNDLRRNMSTHVEDLVAYAKEDGYEAELESEEYMIVHKDDKAYRAHIDRAGDTYYVDKVEEL